MYAKSFEVFRPMLDCVTSCVRMCPIRPFWFQESMSGQAQFHVLHQHLAEVGPASKALLLSTYAKLANLYPECRELVTPVSAA